MSLPVAVAGWGAAAPKQRLTNANLESVFDTSDEWIVERTGISERRVAGPDDTTATLATRAATKALDQARLPAGDVDLLIVATATPDQPLPATAAFVQDSLGLRCGAFDLDAACAGFVYGLVAGASFIAASTARTALVVGAETLTRIVDPDDRGTRVLFGDGAGAVVLRPSATCGILSWDLGCDGAAAGLLGVPAGGSRLPTSTETLAAGGQFLRMDGPEVFKRAVRIVVSSARTTLRRAGLAPGDVDLFVPHQANRRIITAATTRLGIPEDRTVVNIDRYGNTSAASIPIALSEAAERGRLEPGATVLLSGFGAGLTWASAVLRWGAP